MSNKRIIEYNGKKQCIAEWAKEIGVTRTALYKRLETHPPEIALGMVPNRTANLSTTEKRCSRCEQVLPVSEYGAHTKSKNTKKVYSYIPPYCKKCAREYARERHEKIKMECLTKYSNGTVRCAHCGFDDPRALVIDHINEDGNKDRNGKYKSNSYKTFLNQDRDDLQVLCHNCNWIKHVEYKEQLK